MDEKALARLLLKVRSRRLDIASAVAQLKDVPFVELGFATVDTHRSLRFGFPEVVLGEAKPVEQLVEIIGALRARKQSVLVTRLSAEKAKALLRHYPQASYDAVARIFQMKAGRYKAGKVAVVAAGTSDIPIAEEAAVTAEAMGATVQRVYDVGVAGIHRLLRRRADIQGADAAVVVAGMEGALASAVGGLVGIPVVAVPTSIGYGANLGGLSALLAMLYSPLTDHGVERRRIAIPVQMTFLVIVAAYVVAMALIGGAVLARYMLTAIPLVIIVAVSTLLRRVRYWPVAVALIAAIFVAGWFWNPPYGFSPEDNLAYRDYIVLHEYAERFLEARYPMAHVLTAWPAGRTGAAVAGLRDPAGAGGPD